MKRKEAENDRQMDLDEFLVACNMLATRLEVFNLRDSNHFMRLDSD